MLSTAVLTADKASLFSPGPLTADLTILENTFGIIEMQVSAQTAPTASGRPPKDLIDPLDSFDHTEGHPLSHVCL